MKKIFNTNTLHIMNFKTKNLNLLYNTSTNLIDNSSNQFLSIFVKKFARNIPKRNNLESKTFESQTKEKPKFIRNNDAAETSKTYYNFSEILENQERKVKDKNNVSKKGKKIMVDDIKNEKSQLFNQRRDSSFKNNDNFDKEKKKTLFNDYNPKRNSSYNKNDNFKNKNDFNKENNDYQNRKNNPEYKKNNFDN